MLFGVESSKEVNSGECPQFFKYIQKHGVWSGLLTIPVQKFDLPIKVKLEMTIRGLLRSKYAGVIELSESPEEVFEKIQEDSVKTIGYNVLFPMPFPLPIISMVTVNDEELCKGAKVSGSVVTVLKLEHEFPTNYQMMNDDSFRINARIDDDDCGHYESRQHIEEVPEDERWPWLVAILVREDPETFEFLCTGTLVSQLFVLTAAHCFSEEQNVNLTNLILYFGKHDLSNVGEENSQTAQVKRIFKHPQFNPTTLRSDLALVQMSQPTVFSVSVAPLCLWHGKTSLNRVTGKEGLLVGWGRDRKSDGAELKPKMAELPVVPQEECLRSKIDFHYVTSPKTFCAGKRYGNGPCNGDSGSALIYPNREKGPTYWHLRGIISLSLYDHLQYTCNSKQYAVFTDVAKYIPWLTKILRTQG